MSYEMVLDFIRSSKDYYEVNGVRVYPSERIIMIEAGGFYIVIQAQDEDAWRKILDFTEKRPSYLLDIVEYVETSSETLIPGTVTVMRLKKEDVEDFLP